MDTSHLEETFRGLLLRHRGRLGLSQGELAGRIGVNRRSLQDWEAGANHPRQLARQNGCFGVDLVNQIWNFDAHRLGREQVKHRGRSAGTRYRER